MTVKRACFIGDSLTLGVGDPLGVGWVGRLAQAERSSGVDLTAYNLGVRRETSTDIKARWSTEVAPRLPAGTQSVIVFAFGTNDCLIEDRAPRVALTEALSNARTILGRASGGRPTLMVGPPLVSDNGENDRIAELSSRLAALCAQLSVPFFDSFALLQNDSSWSAELASGDGYHPSGRGYSTLADAIGAWAPWRLFVGADE